MIGLVIQSVLTFLAVMGLAAGAAFVAVWYIVRQFQAASEAEPEVEGECFSKGCTRPLRHKGDLFCAEHHWNNYV